VVSIRKVVAVDSVVQYNIYPRIVSPLIKNKVIRRVWRCAAPLNVVRPANSLSVSEFALGTIDLEQGGDDDDVFLALHRIQEAKRERQQAKQTSEAATTKTPTGGTSENPPVKKKVVIF
jgi:hypothetical protein